MSTNVTFVGFLGHDQGGLESIEVMGQCENWPPETKAEEAVGHTYSVRILDKDMKTNQPIGGKHSPMGPHRCAMIVGSSGEKVEVELQLEYVEREGAGMYEGTATILRVA